MKITTRNTAVSAFFLSLLFPATAQANIVWPALYLEQKLLSPYPILFGLVIEYLVIRKITGFTIRKSILVTLAMNFFSALVGMIAVPLVGLAWEFFHEFVLDLLFSFNTFHPINLVVNVFVAALTSASLEWWVIRFWFKTKIGRKGFGWLVLANVVSTALALALYFLDPPPYY